MGFILNPLYNIVSGVIVAIHKVFSPIFGADSGVTWTISIIGLVVLIRIILIPLFVKQIKSQRALTVLQPQMKEIPKKYKDDRQKQSEEMMKLVDLFYALCRASSSLQIASVDRPCTSFESLSFVVAER